MRVCCDVRFVGDEDDGVALFVQARKQRHNFFAGLRIKIAGGLVRKQNGRIVHQRARNRHALALAAGKLIGLVHHAFGQIHLLQRFSRTFQAFFGRSAVVNHRQLHVVQARSRAAIN